MKKLVFIFPVVFLFALPCAGQIMPAGVKVISGGLKVDSVFLVLQGKSVQVVPFPAGSKLTLALSGIHGFSLHDNKVFPGCSMKVLDKDNKDILDYADLFQDVAAGVDRDDSKFLVLSLPIGAPIVENASYRWRVRVWDKSGKAEMTIEIPVTVSSVKDMLGIKKTSSGLACQNAFVMSGVPLTSNQVTMGEELDFVVMGVTGFSIQSDKVKIGAGMTIKDKTGDTILEYTDVFKGEETNDLKEVETLRLNLKIGEPMSSGNTYQWTIKVWDKVTQKAMEASCFLHVK